MSIENIKLLQSLKEGLLEDKVRASKLLDKYAEIAYGPNVDYNSEEAQDADVLHDALLHHIENIDEQLDSVDHQIAREEKKLAHSNILFRPHRGSLADAMAEIQEFKSERELREYIAAKEKEHGRNIKPEDIRIELYSDLEDERIAWPRSYTVEYGHGVAGFLTYGVSLEDSLKAFKKFYDVFN